MAGLPPKDPQSAVRIKEATTKGRYRFTEHAVAQMKERKVITAEVTYVLKNGYCESSKDAYDEKHGNWKYAVRGHTVDGRDLRIIVVLKANMMIVTVIDKEK